MARNPECTFTSPEAVKSINIDYIPDFDMCDYDLTNPKEFKKLSDRIEKVCRSSYEYRAFINYLRDFGDMNKCSFLKYITNTESREIRIEIHHEPLTLYDIVQTVLKKRMTLNELIDEEMVAKEVMWNHYRLHVGLIPLSETVHEMVHNQYLFIPVQAIFGRWREFVNEYNSFIDPEILSNLEKLDKLSESYDMDSNTVLNPGMVYVNVDDPEYQASAEELYKLSQAMIDQSEANMMKTE